MLVNRKTAESTDGLRPEQTLLVAVECGPVGAVFIRPVSFLAGGVFNAGGIFFDTVHVNDQIREHLMISELKGRTKYASLVLSCKRTAHRSPSTVFIAQDHSDNSAISVFRKKRTIFFLDLS